MTTVTNLAQELLSLGVERFFGVPGGGATLELIDELAKHGSTFTLTKSESASVIMAGSFGMMTGSVGVSMSIKGPGLANAMPGLALAMMENLPVLHFVEAFSAAENHKMHKRMDHEKLVSEVTKRFLSVVPEGGLLRSITEDCRAYPAGPVVIQLISDDEEGETRTRVSTNSAVPLASNLELFRQARTPVFILGQAAEEWVIQDFLKYVHAPVFTTVAAKGSFDEGEIYAAGVYTGAGGRNSAERNILKQSDLIIGIGLRQSELLDSPSAPEQIVNFFRPGRVGATSGGLDNFHHIAELPTALRALGRLSWKAADITQIRDCMRARLVRGFSPGAVIEAVQQALGQGVTYVADTGDFATYAEHLVRAQTRFDFVSASQSRFMGAGIPLAIGASLGAQTRLTVLFVGDGGLGQYFAEATVALSNELPLIILFLSDGGFGSIVSRATNLDRAGQLLQIDGSRWVTQARALGFQAVNISTIESLCATLESWKEAPRPLFVQVEFTRGEYSENLAGIR